MTPTDRPTREDALRALNEVSAMIVKESAACVRGDGLPSDCQEDHRRKVPRWVLRLFSDMQESMRLKGIRLADSKTNIQIIRAYIENNIVIDRDKVPVGLREAVAFRQQNYDRNMYAIKSFYGMNCDRPEKSHDDKLFEAAALLAEKVEG